MKQFWRQIKKELDRDFEISIYVIILIVGLSILVFSCMKASYEITKLKEENNALRTNIEELKRWFRSYNIR